MPDQRRALLAGRRESCGVWYFARMSIQIGDTLPDATFRRLTAEGPQEVSAAEFFAGRKVVVLAVPGAFTPTCNNDHLPSYAENADAIKAKGVDEIACIAVNDMFVMDAWAKAAGVEGRVTLLSDGNGEFTEKVGMVLDGAGFGLGNRSLRYSMLVDDGEVKTLNVEENPGVCTVTNGATILDSL